MMMNLSTILVAAVLLTLYILAFYHVVTHRGSCSDCGLSGVCPIQTLRKKARQPNFAAAAAVKEKPHLSAIRVGKPMRRPNR
jgi:hypothetical protein